MFLAIIRTIPALAAAAVLVTALSLPCQQPPIDAQPATPSTATLLGLFERSDGTLGADGKNYVANFDQHGASMQVAHPSDDEQLVSLTLRLLDWGRTEAAKQFAATGARAPTPLRANRDTVHYTHTGITERYTVQGAGFEQSFELHQ